MVDIAVTPGQRLEQSAPLLKLARLSTLWVEIAVPASGVRAIRPGARVDVDGYDTPGRVVLVSETTDAATQTVLVRAEVPNTGELRPGQTAAARISFLSPARGRLGDPLQRAHPARRGDLGLRRNRGRFSAGAGHASRRGPRPRRGLRRDHRQGHGGDQRRIGAAGHSAGPRAASDARTRGRIRAVAAPVRRPGRPAAHRRRRRPPAHLADRCISRRLAGPGERSS